MTNDDHFGDWLRRRRKELDLTQHELADRAGCSAVMIRKIEAGERRPSRQIAEALLRRLEVTPDHCPALVSLARQRPEPGGPGHALGGAAPAAEAAERAPARLPVPPRRLLGRERLISQAADYLRGETRLLTLTGPGGIGKTCLGLGVLEAAGDAFESVFFVPLAQLSDPDLVLPTIAQAVGIQERPGDRRLLLRQLCDVLAGRRAVLALDNFEHLLGAARAVDELIDALPLLRVLATSRAALRLRQEQLLPVPPLELPAPGLEAAPGTLRGCPAVELFVERASAVCPGFALDEGNAASVAQICRQLDGLPLAIGLAAAWVRLFAPQAILARLSDCLALLVGGPLNAPDRHQTLRGAIAASYHLLGDGERRLFACLGVFVGGCRLDDALAVGAGLDGQAGGEGLPVLALLAALADHSLVQDECCVDDEPRLRLLETLRAYALEQLDGFGLRPFAERRHALAMLALAEAAADGLSGPGQLGWLARLERDHDNARAALRWAIAAGESEIGLRLAGALWRFWYVRSYFGEGRSWLAAVLALPGALDFPQWYARAANGAGNLAYKEGDLAEAERFHQESLALSRQLGDWRGVAGSLNNLGLIARAGGCRENARRLFGEAIELNRALGNRLWEAINLNNLGNVFYDLGQAAQAAELQSQSLALFGALEDSWGVAMALCDLGHIRCAQGDPAAAHECYARSLELRLELRDKEGIAVCLYSLGALAETEGDCRLAAALYEESLCFGREQGNARAIAWVLARLAALAADSERAADLAAAARAHWLQGGAAPVAACCSDAAVLGLATPAAGGGCAAPFGPRCQPSAAAPALQRRQRVRPSVRCGVAPPRRRSGRRVSLVVSPPRCRRGRVLYRRLYQSPACFRAADAYNGVNDGDK